MLATIGIILSLHAAYSAAQRKFTVVVCCVFPAGLLWMSDSVSKSD